MKIKNVSVKVIGIAGRDLMPDQTMECNEFIVKNAAVDTLVKMGLLAIDDSAEKEKALKEAALKEAREQLLKEQAEAAKTENAGEEAPAETPKRTRRTTKPAE